MAATQTKSQVGHIKRPWVEHTTRPQVGHMTRPRVGHTTRPLLEQYSPAADSTRAGEFGEMYSEDVRPKAEGVVPSVFGAANIIDFTLRHNGIAVSDGLPALVRLPDTSGGVCGMRILGKYLNVNCDSSARVTLSGSALSKLQLPNGFSSVKSDDGYCWKGGLGIGERVTLSRN